jgi:hypothetical protein
MQWNQDNMQIENKAKLEKKKHETKENIIPFEYFDC